MTLRTFLFCDVCNTSGFRSIEMRRSPTRTRDGSGRRISDGRSWFEGNREEAQAAGWNVDDDNRDVCPRCAERAAPSSEPSRDDTV